RYSCRCMRDDSKTSSFAQRDSGELGRSERRWRALVEHVSDGISLSSRDGRILYASPSTARMTGFSPDAYTGKNLFELVHPDDRTLREDQVGECVRAPGVAVFGEQRMAHADGSYRHIEAVRVNRLDDPDIGAIVTSYRDVTENRALRARFLQAQRMDAVGRLAG